MFAATFSAALGTILASFWVGWVTHPEPTFGWESALLSQARLAARQGSGRSERRPRRVSPASGVAS